MYLVCSKGDNAPFRSTRQKLGSAIAQWQSAGLVNKGKTLKARRQNVLLRGLISRVIAVARQSHKQPVVMPKVQVACYSKTRMQPFSSDELLLPFSK